MKIPSDLRQEAGRDLLRPFAPNPQNRLEWSEEGTEWSVMMSETAGMKIEPAGPCLCSVEFLDGEYMETNPLIEAQKTVKGKYADTEHVKFKTLPEVTFASTVHKGSYDGISAANAAVAE